MDNQDHIFRKIKEEFESSETKAPENLWAGISGHLDAKDSIIDEQVKLSFENLFEPAPARIWEGIDKQLTIDKGWKKVYNYLRLRTFFRRTRRIAAILLLVLFGATVLNNIFHKGGKIRSINHQHQAISKEKELQITFSDDDTTSIPVASEEISSFGSPFVKSNPFSGESSSNLIAHGSALTFKEKNHVNDHVSLHSGEDANPQYGKIKELNQELHQKYKVQDQISNNDSLKDIVIQNDTLKNGITAIDSNLTSINEKENNEIEDNRRNTERKESRFELGMLMGINSTAIINNTTVNSFKETSLVSFVPSFGGNIGIQFVYHINDRHGFASNLTYTSINQQYEIFSSGSLNRELLHFNIIDFQPLYQFSYRQIKRPEKALNIKAGPFFGYITNSKRTVNNTSEPLPYSQFDFGLTLQVGQSIEFNRLILDYGLNMESGLINLNKGVNNLPASIDRTTHLGLGAYLSLRYKL